MSSVSLRLDWGGGGEDQFLIMGRGYFINFIVSRVKATPIMASRGDALPLAFPIQKNKHPFVLGGGTTLHFIKYIL